MANVLIIPTSGALIFDNNTSGSSTASPLTDSSQLKFDGSGGLTISSFVTASSALNRFSVDGVNGRLFSVNDSLTGNIFSVNDAAGLPIINVESSLTDKITMGTFGSNALVVNDTLVGIGTSTPNEKLTINGNLSSNAVIFSSGGNSTEWEETFSTVKSNSASWGLGGGDPTVSTVMYNNSANWNSVYNQVNTNSASWGVGGGDPTVSTVMYNNSANWNSVYNSYNSTSANFYSSTSNVSQGTFTLNRGESPTVVDLALKTTDSPTFSTVTTTQNLSVFGGIVYQTVPAGSTETRVLLSGAGNLIRWRTVDSRAFGSTLVAGSSLTIGRIPKMSATTTMVNSIITETTIQNVTGLFIAGTVSAMNVVLTALQIGTTENNVIVSGTSGRLLARTADNRIFGTNLIDGSLTSGFLTKSIGGQSIGNSLIIDNGTTLSAGGPLTVNGTISSNSVIYDNNGNSTDWNRVSTSYLSNSATFWRGAVETQYIPKSIGTNTFTNSLLYDNGSTLECTGSFYCYESISLDGNLVLNNGEILDNPNGTGSPQWSRTYNTVTNTSARWESNYNTVQSNSASWGNSSGSTGPILLKSWLPTENQPPSAGFATIDTRGGFPVLEFSETAGMSAIFPTIIPPNLDFTGGMQVSIRWTCTTETNASYTVGWLVDTQVIGISSLDNIGNNWFFLNTISAVSVPTTSGVTKVTSTTFGYSALSTLSAGDYFRLRIRRDIANDNARGNAELVSVQAVILTPP